VLQSFPDLVGVRPVGDEAVEEVFVEEAGYIMAETLSVELVRGEAPRGAVVKEYEIDGLAVRLCLVKR